MENKWVSIIIEIIMGVIAIFIIGAIAYRAFFDTELPHKFSVLMITSENEDESFKILKRGMEQSAVDNNCEITYLKIEENGTQEEYEEILDREIWDDIDGVIVDGIHFQSILNYMNENYPNIKLLLLRGNNNLDEVDYAITMNDYEVGYQLAKEMLVEYKKDDKVGVVVGNLTSQTQRERLQGVKDAIAEVDGVKIEWQIAYIDENESSLRKMETRSKVEHLIILDRKQTERTLDETIQQDYSFTIYGIGCEKKEIYYLDQGTIGTLVVADEFKTGYMGIQTMTQLVTKNKVKELYEIGFFIVNQENLYQEECQKLLFSNTQ